MNVRGVFAAGHRFCRPLVWLSAITFLVSCTLGPVANQPLQWVSGSAPIYPANLLADGIAGQVTVRYDVTVDGRAVNASVTASEPLDLFDESALQAERSWRFKPRVQKGEAQAVLGLTSTLEFRIPRARATYRKEEN